MADLGPYVDKDCKDCNRILYSLNDLLGELDRQDAIGIDTTEARLRRDDLVKQLHQFKATYFPGR
jgi:hypothetical protein